MTPWAYAAPIGPGSAATAEGGDTDAVVAFLASKIAPILLAVLGVIFIGYASRGRIRRVMTSSVIALIGLGFIRRSGVAVRLRRLSHRSDLPVRMQVLWAPRWVHCPRR
jgi:hypothetical protein